ncbi:DUF4307 domain-containing protein [Georgenia sp. Z1344]|uniref:DUF4307 domain-containing protein n=1 Tax=Georgenia sp. Z1344 TaxID=3416706 RepID=UPI003CF13FF8
MTSGTTANGTDEGPGAGPGPASADPQPGAAAGPGIDPDLVRRRYGRGRPTGNRRAQWLVPLLGAFVLVAGATVLAWQMSREPSVSVEHVGYTVEGPDEVEVRFVVVADPGTEVVCTLRAVNRDFTEVGVREVRLGPVTERRTAAVEPVLTSERAASGHAESCRVA